MASECPPTRGFKPTRSYIPQDRERVFSDSEAEGAVLDAEQSLRNIRQSSAALRQELEALHLKRKALQSSRQLISIPELPSPKAPLSTVDSLAPEDIITNPEVLDFLHRHFLDETEIATDDFIAALERDYFQLTPEVCDEFIRLVTIDPDYISLNRLKILTEKKGLEDVLQDIIETQAETEKAAADQVNETIIAEIAELNEMITQKAQHLEIRESQIAAQVKDLQVHKNRLIDRIQTETETAAQRWISEIKNQGSLQFKRLQRLEKLLNEKIKTAKNRPNPVEKVVNFEGEKLAAENSRLKARILALEKTIETLKGKQQGVESELDTCRSQLTKSTEELSRLKGRNAYLEQVAGDYKKLRESQTVKAPEPAEPVTVIETPGPNTSAVLCLSVLDVLVAGLSDTLPLFFANTTMKSQNCSQFSSARSSMIGGNGETWPGFGRLLYPTFQVLVPRLVETVPVSIETGRGTESVVGLLSAVVLRTYAESLEDRETFVFPQRLDFQPSTDSWNIANFKKGKTRIQPLYTLFARSNHQKFAVQSLCKLLTYPALSVSLQAAALVLLLSDSPKSLEKALRSVKSHLTDSKTKTATCAYLLSDPSDPLTTIEAVLHLSREALSVLVCEILLLLQVERGLGGQPRKWSGLLVAAEHSEDSELEEYIVVLLQKLVSSGSLSLQHTPLLSKFRRRSEQLSNSTSQRFVRDNLVSILELSS